MFQSDTVQRFVFERHDIRGELVNLSDSFRELLANKVYPAPVENLLGQFLVASVLLSTTIKFKGRLVLQARSNGSVPLIMAECSSDRFIRGIARYDEALLAEGINPLLGEGTLAITIEREKGEPYQGIVPLESDDLASCLQNYFSRSEQLDSRFVLASGDETCSGFMLQQLPAQLDMNPTTREDNWNTVTRLAQTLTNDELLELENDRLLIRLFNHYPLRMFPLQQIEHRCTCTRQRTAEALFAIGRDEVMSIVAEQGRVEINCEFCSKQYDFEPDELETMFANPGDTSMH